MQASDFSKPTTPGRLEKTHFRERLPETLGIPRLVEGWGYVPHDLPAGLDPASVVSRVFPQLLAAQAAVSMLEGVARNQRNPLMLLGPFARTEAKHSSAIENTFASDEQLALFDMDDTAVDASRRPDVGDVHNYLEALRHGWLSEKPIGVNLIRDMHRVLLANSTRIEGRPGEFRTSQNAIGNRSAPFSQAKFVPPPPQFVDACWNSLEKYIHADDDMPPLIKVALVHYQFECIHPFDDGNGRVGRLLAALQLAQKCNMRLPIVYVSRFFDKHRELYYDLLQGKPRRCGKIGSSSSSAPYHTSQGRPEPASHS
ncbi:MAG: Fic family protein [Planctomycetes bacterium]|nr:Fic family protein [Planctomycetota bacterium]